MALACRPSLEINFVPPFFGSHPKRPWALSPPPRLSELGQGDTELLPVFQMQMAELLVSHGASLSARTSMDEMPIGKSSTTAGVHI